MHIYETLFGFDENVKPIPILAESVEISPDGLTYRIPLRKGVKFHNGKEMTARTSRPRWSVTASTAPRPDCSTP